MSEPDRVGDEADDAELVVPSAPGSIASVRRYAVDACAGLGFAESADTIALLVSEVATNAVLHAYGPVVRVRVRERGTRLRVEVFDSSPVLPVQRRALAAAEDGRGLALLAALATDWGVDSSRGGTTIWFEVGR